MWGFFRDERIRTFINNFEDYSFTVKLHPPDLLKVTEMNGFEPLSLTLEVNILPLNYIPFYNINLVN
jgi:hypothetical protein